MTQQDYRDAYAKSFAGQCEALGRELAAVFGRTRRGRAMWWLSCKIGRLTR
jgi:hypothetical protein